MRYDVRSFGALLLLTTTPALAQAQDPTAVAEAAKELSLVACQSFDSTRNLRDKAGLLADHVRAGYAETYPAAVILAASMAELAEAFDAQLRLVEPTHREFQTAWAEFERLVRRSPLPRDPALGPVLPGFKRSAAQLESLMGCEPPSDAAAMIPCSAIPIAHLLAVVAGQIEHYLSDKYAENLPEQVAAAGELDRTAKALHHVLHDLEVAVPSTPIVFRALDSSFGSTMLTDENDAEDLEVKSRLAELGLAVRALEKLTTSCHQAEAGHEAHDGHEGH
jgi:hypothetical protein